MSEIRTNLIISGDNLEYRCKISISVITLDTNLVDTQSSFRTNLNIESSNYSTKTILELNNERLDFYLVDVNKIKKTILYFSNILNTNFEPELLWSLLEQNTNEQINISHLTEALKYYLKKEEYEEVINILEEHTNNNIIHISQQEREFIEDIMINKPWEGMSPGGGGSEVSYTPIVTSGEHLGNIIINGRIYKIYSPKINLNGYVTIDSLNTTNQNLSSVQNRVKALEDLGLELRTLSDGTKVLLSIYDFISEGEITAGGISEESDVPTGTVITLGGLLNVDSTADDIYSIDKILVKKANETHYSVMDLSEVVGLDEDALSKYLTTNSYATHSWVEQQGYLTEHQDISGLLSKDEATNTYATQAALGTLQTAHDTLRNEFNALEALLSDDTAGVIDTWNDVKAFLDGYSESEDLATILSKMNAQIDLKANQSDVNTILDWFALRTLSNGKKVLYTKYGIAMDGEISVGGISDDMGGDSGDSYSRLDSWDNYNPANGDVLSAVLGYGLKTDIQSLQEQINNMGGGGLSSVTVKIGNTAYDSVDGVVSLPSYPVVPTLLSEFTDDVVAGHYLPIEGGYFANSLNYKSTSAYPLILGSTTSAEQCVILLRHNDVDKAQIGWSSSSGTYLYNYTLQSRLGVNNNGVAYFNNYTLYHTGNFDPANYLPKSGGTITGPLTIQTGADTKLIFNNTDGEKYTVCSFRENGAQYADLLVNSGGFFYNNQLIIHSGNIGSQSVASATKLQTARTIWGQSFDGTGNVGGIPLFNAYAEKDYISTAALMINKTGSLFGIGTAKNVYNISFGLVSGSGAWESEFMTIANTGNVLIGTTTDDGYKLAVNGDVKSEGFVSTSIDIEKNSQTGEINRTTGKLYLQFNNYNHLILCQGGGYVGIGTVTPAYRLDVSGTGRFTDTLTIGGATLSWDATHNCLRVNTNLATDGELTAGGVSDDDSTDTGVSYNRLDSWDAYNAGAGDVLSATLGYGLKMNIEAIDGLISNLQSQIDALGSGSGGSVSGDYLPLTGGTLTGSITVKGANTGYMWARESDGVALGRLETDGVNLRFRDYNQLISGGYHTIITHQNIWDYAISNTGGEIYGDLYTYANITSEAAIVADFISGNSGGEFSGDVYIAANLFVDGEFNYSDMRYKDVLEDIYIPNDVIADAPIFRYRWTDKFDNKLHIGTSAQYWEEYDNTLVSIDPRSGKLGLNYISLAVAMGQSNANEVRELKKEILKLKERLAAYEQ